MPWTDLSFPFGSILTSSKMTQLDDNFEALANADSGAPTIQHDTAPAVSAGGTTQARVDKEYTETGTSYRRMVEWKLGVHGTIRVYFEFRLGGSGAEAQVRLLKNGSEVDSWATTSGTYVSRSHDVSVAFGDVLELQGRHTGGGSEFLSIRRMRLQTDGGNPVMVAVISVLDNDDTVHFS